MPLIIIHGDGPAVSLKSSSIKGQFSDLEVVEVDAESLNSGQIQNYLSAQGLFAGIRLVLVSNPKPDLDVTSLTIDDQTTVLFVFPKTIPSKSKILETSKALKPQIYNLAMAENTKIFAFIDSLFEKKSRCLAEVEILKKEFGVQYLLTMIFYGLRRLVLSQKSKSDFVMKKINHQKRNFPQEKILNLYDLTLETDFKIKRGLADENIALNLLINKFIN